MRLLRAIVSILIFVSTYIGISPVQAANEYIATWSLSNSGIPEPYFTLWPSRMAGFQAFRGVLPACTAADPTDCIKSVEYQDLQSNWIKGKLASYFPVEEDNETIPGKSAFKFTESIYSENPVKDSILPKSARSSLWTFPGIEHSGGSKFLLSFAIFRSGNDKQLLPSTAPTDISIVPISDSIQSISKAELDERIPYGSLISDPNSKTRCYYDAVALKKYCTQREDFTNLKPIRLTVNFKKHLDIFQIVDWFTARNQNTEISMKKLVDGSADLTFQGIPISINSAESYRPATVENYILGRKIMNIAFEATQQPGIKPYAFDLTQTKCFNPTPYNWIPNCSEFADMTLHGGGSTEDASGYFTWRELEKYFPILPKDTVTVWNFKTMNPAGQDFLDLLRCSSRTEPSGVLSSNASLLVPSPPKWNKENESLDYNLASTHLDTNGKVVTGFYELRVSALVAKCLWGNDLSNAKAQIQIFSASDNAVQSIEVSTLEIKDGYISFRASGFHYSANQIQLKIIGASQVQIPEDASTNNLANPPSVAKTTPSPTPKIAIATPKKMNTITCVKGKLSKKVTAAKPVCPTGYKKK